MILSSGMRAVAAQETFEVKLTPRNRFTALAFASSSASSPCFAISSCKFGDLEIIGGGICRFEEFEKLFPHLDVSERTCLDGKEIVVQGMSITVQVMVMSLSFAGWEG